MTHRLKRTAQMLLLPLSALPLFGVVPLLAQAYTNFARRHESGPLPAMKASFSAWEARRYVPMAAHPDAVPVLAYASIDDSGAATSVTREQFAKQMALLRRLGFRTVSIAQYGRFLRGDRRGLPARPVLVTFDGGSLDSYRGADRVLRDERFRATMFVAAGRVAVDDAHRLSWRELHAMDRSGRWDIQEQAGRGDGRIAYDARGDTAPFYVVRRYLRSTGTETLAAWEQRVSSDIFEGGEQLAEHLPDYEPVAFAAPYGDTGRRTTNDPRIRPLLGQLLGRQFAVTFVVRAGGAPSYTTAAMHNRVAERFPVAKTTSTDDLFRWLRDHVTASTPTPPKTGENDVRNSGIRGQQGLPRVAARWPAAIGVPRLRLGGPDARGAGRRAAHPVGRHPRRAARAGRRHHRR